MLFAKRRFASQYQKWHIVIEERATDAVLHCQTMPNVKYRELKRWGLPLDMLCSRCLELCGRERLKELAAS